MAEVNYEAEIDSPNEPLGFEINPLEESWTFVPEFYPEEFTDMKKRDLDRHGSGCETQSVSVKETKNKEVVISGKVLRGELPVLRALQDVDKPVDVISPLFEDGGLECYVKRAERGNQQGWDPFRKQRYFQYNIDLVSTGKDEGSGGRNEIVSSIL